MIPSRLVTFQLETEPISELFTLQIGLWKSSSLEIPDTPRVEIRNIWNSEAEIVRVRTAHVHRCRRDYINPFHRLHEFLRKPYKQNLAVVNRKSCAR